MNPEQYAKWRSDAFQSLALSEKFLPEEIEFVLEWFDSIKGQKERDLIGDALVDAHCNMCDILVDDCKKYFNSEFLYFSLMSRLWIYAPIIIAEKLNKDSKS